MPSPAGGVRPRRKSMMREISGCVNCLEWGDLLVGANIQRCCRCPGCGPSSPAAIVK